jgi:hypothetical protein
MCRVKGDRGGRSGEAGGTWYQGGMVDVREWWNEGGQRKAMQRDGKAWLQVIEWAVGVETSRWEIRFYWNRDGIGKETGAQ